MRRAEDGFCGWKQDKKDPFCSVISVRGAYEIQISVIKP
jgi:hypothetical protein